MSLENPVYWLCYVGDAAERGPIEATAIAPEVIPTHLLTADAQGMLRTADAYHREHPGERVVFVAAVTRWLTVSCNRTWNRLGIDLYVALAELDERAPALLIEVSEIARAVVSDTATGSHVVMYPDGRVEDVKPHTEPVRAALVAALERDWPTYIRRVVARQAARQQ